MTLEDRLTRIEELLAALVEARQVKAFYTVAEFARLVGRAPFTVRQWCTQGRLAARKKVSGRGAYAAWAIAHEEYERFQRDGLRPAASVGGGEAC